MTLSGLGISQSDLCYDPNHPWYDPFGLIHTDAECACLEAAGVPLGEQCPTFQGTVELMSQQAGSVIGAGSSAIGEGIGTGVATGLTGFTQSVNFSGIALLALAGAAVFMLSKR